MTADDSHSLAVVPLYLSPKRFTIPKTWEHAVIFFIPKRGDSSHLTTIIWFSLTPAILIVTETDNSDQRPTMDYPMNANEDSNLAAPSVIYCLPYDTRDPPNSTTTVKQLFSLGILKVFLRISHKDNLIKLPTGVFSCSDIVGIVFSVDELKGLPSGHFS